MVKRALLAVALAFAGISFAQAGDLAQPEGLSVPTGTLIHCRTNQTLTTKLDKQGQAFTFSVAEPVSINGSVVIPAGSTLAGHITLMERPSRIKGVGQMRLTVEQISFPGGRSLPLGATLLTAYGVENVKVVGTEGLVKGPNSRFGDFEEIGAGTAGGILMGLIFAHPVVGVTVGLTATTVDRLRRRGKDLTIPAGTEVTYQLTRDLPLASSAPREGEAISARPAGK